MPYSEQEKIEFFKYKKRIDNAVEEKEFFFVYIKNVKVLDEQIKSKKPKAQLYIIDYIKKLIKSKKKNSEIKFRAVLLLKDLLTLENEKLVDYNEKKLLTRLFKIASKKEKRFCLFNKTIKEFGKKYGEKLYRLILECFKNWGKSFGRNHFEYSKYKSKLRKNLPQKEIYFNFPNEKKEILRYFNNKIDFVFSLKQDLIKNFFILEENRGNDKIKCFVKVYNLLKNNIGKLEDQIILESFENSESEKFLGNLQVHLLFEFFRKFQKNFEFNFNKNRKDIFFSEAKIVIGEFYPEN